jgi:hypothetical protein
MAPSCELRYHYPTFYGGRSDSLNRIDDVQDGSTKRRGLPAAHCIFGVAQTINSANLLFVKAISQAHAISPATLDAFIGE